MSAPQWTFALVAILLASGGTLVTYPGVRAHARSARESFLAALMASTLAALPVAMLAATIVNVVKQGGTP